MTWLKHRRGVYDARQRHVNDVCRRYDVTETTYNNTFEDTYNRVTSRDQGESFKLTFQLFLLVQIVAQHGEIIFKKLQL